MASTSDTLIHPDVRSYTDVNRDALRLLTRPGPGYLALLGMSVSLVGLLGFCWMWQLAYGMGMSGLNNPVGWGTYITTFV
nr:hypothetical protein [Gemmatimonadota bacterium]